MVSLLTDFKTKKYKNVNDVVNNSCCHGKNASDITNSNDVDNFDVLIQKLNGHKNKICITTVSRKRKNSLKQNIQLLAIV